MRYLSDTGGTHKASEEKKNKFDHIQSLSSSRILIWLTPLNNITSLDEGWS